MNRLKGGFQYSPSEYGHLLNDVCSGLSKSASLAEAAGILPEQIIVDPGIGFGKSASQNLALLNYVDLIRKYRISRFSWASPKVIYQQRLGR